VGRQRSSGYAVEVHKGLITANEYAVLFKPRIWTADASAPAAIYCPALAAGAYNVFGWFVASRLAERGIPVLATDLGDTPTVYAGVGLNATVGGTGSGGPGSWATDAVMDKVTAAHTYLTGKMKAKTQVILMGGSHGGAAASRWAAANPTLVSCLLMGIGAVDMQEILTANPSVPSGPVRPSIQAAWGLGGGTVLPATSSGHKANLPLTGVACAPLIECPVWDLYSADDPIVVASTHVAFAAANPSKITAEAFASVGHSLTDFPYDAAADWALSHS
jgi:dienelactone hydrolase